MDRLDRLFGLLLELQDGRVRTAAELADRFGVSVRTLYRDAATLVREGIPLRSEAGVGYQLRSGFFLSPLDFTPEEAVVLRLGLSWMQGHTRGRWARQTSSALAKVGAALGPRARTEAERLATLVQLFSEKRTLDLDDPRVRLCLRAVGERRTLRLAYTARGRNDRTERIVEPLGLQYNEGVWYLEAWCRLREGLRAFRFDRIEELAWHGQPCPIRPREDQAPRRWVVLLDVPPDRWRWLVERQHWGWTGQQEREQVVRASYAVDDLEEFLAWLLSWGPGLAIVEPDELKAMVRSRAQEWIRLLT